MHSLPDTISIDNAAQKTRVQYVRICAICLVVVSLAYMASLADVLVPTRYFLPLHLILEFSSIVVSFAVFTTGWFGYRQTRNARDLIIGVTFMAAGTVDFVHTLSYQGMPDFLGTNHPGKAAAYWMLARLAVGAGLLAAAHITPQTKSNWLTPSRMVPIVGLVVLGIVGLVSAIPNSGELFFVQSADHLALQSEGRLTPLKVCLEYLVIATYLLGFFVISEKRGWDTDTVTWLRKALLVAIFAEVAFTLYASPYSPINALGHILKTAAYYLILNALFVSALQRPYEQLSKTSAELKALYADAREHRREAERSFARIGSALSSSLQIDQALDRIADLAADMLHADYAIVASLDKHTGAVRVAAQKGGCHDAHRPVDLTLRVGRDALNQMKSIVIPDLQATGMVDCAYDQPDCLRSVLCAPMIYENQPMGIVSIYSHSRHAFEEGDTRLLEAFAAHAAVAVHNALIYERESRISDILQRSIISPTRIRVDKFEIAQVYEPATDEALVGGDFYDVIELPDGKVGLVIGDVSGKGLSAAVHTAMVKYTLRAYLAEGHAPSEAARLLNIAVSEFIDDNSFVTLFLGVLDPETCEIVYINAGHEPPVYVHDGSYLTLPSTGPALGFGIDQGYEEGRVRMSKGSVLALYTDGISEARRNNSVLMGTEGIGEQLLRCEELSSEDVAKCVHAAAKEFAGGNLRDDAAILAVRAL